MTKEAVGNKAHSSKKTVWQRVKKDIFGNYDLYLMILPVVVFYIIFAYMPMYGVQLAFRDFNPRLGIWDSPWLDPIFFNFQRFFNSFVFNRLMFNTIAISLYSLAVGMPASILLALMLNEVRQAAFKKTVQLVTYLPHFISTVVMVGMITIFLSPRIGMVNNIIAFFGGDRISFMTEPSMFKSIYVWSGVWQGVGFGSIIYLAALSSISPELHEAATIDGASRLRRIWHINLPGITPTIMILLILSAGGIMNVGFEKVFLMQNELTMSTSDVISTYVYRIGLLHGDFGFSSAVGLFNSVVNMILLVVVNFIATRFGDTGLW